MTTVNVALVSGKRIIQAESLHLQGQSVTVKAVRGARYVLTEGETLVGPENITIKRVGKNLQVMLEGSDGSPQLIIEHFYDQSGELVGLGEDGQWHRYISANAEMSEEPETLQDGEMSPVLLSSDTTAPLENLSVDGHSWSAGLIALAALGAATALVFLSTHHGSQGQHDTSDAPAAVTDAVSSDMPQATLDAIVDDVGNEQGNIPSGGTSDDNMPTLNGSGQLPGSLIEIRDNGELLGSTRVDADGNWRYTPTVALADGEHALDVVVTDPNGNVSLPSDPTLIIIDTSSTPVADAEPPATVFSLEDLLPADAALDHWALMQAPEDTGAVVNLQPDETDALLNALLNDSHLIH